MYSYAPQLTSTIAAAQQADDWLPHRDRSGIVFMWSDSVEGPPPADAPRDRIIDASGYFIDPNAPQQAGTLPSGEPVPSFGPTAETPANAYWGESVSRPRSPIFTRVTPRSDTTSIPGYLKPGGPPAPGGVVEDAKTAARNKAFKEVGLLAVLTAPAWGTVLLGLLFGR